MKQFLITFCLLCFYINASKAQPTIEQLCEGAADNIYKLIKKNIPEQSKIAVLYFEGQTGSSNSIKTMLGIRISSKVAAYVAQKLNKKEFIILFPENTQEKKFFNLPSTAAEEEQFYKKLNENQRPDYFITGKYNISNNFSVISLSELVLKENKYKNSSPGKPYAFEPVSSNISPSDIEELKSLNIEFSEDDDYMNKILQFSESSEDLFSCSMHEVGNPKPIEYNGKLIVGKSYVIKIDVVKPCYIYAFFYMPEDKEHPYLMPLYPFEVKEQKVFNPGEHYIPHADGFEIEPPAGSTYIKVIASLKPLSLQITSVKDKDGYYITSINKQDAEVFYTSLSSSYKNKLPLKAQILNFKVDYK